MKLSATTLKVLSNFASINQGIRFKKGNVQCTMCTKSTIIAKAILQEEFPIDFAIYNLETLIKQIKFIGGDPELDFKEDHLQLFAEGGKRHKRDRIFFFADPVLIQVPPKIPFDHDDVSLAFSLPKDDLANIKSEFTYDQEYNLTKIWKRDGETTLTLTNINAKNRAFNNLNIVVGGFIKEDLPDFTLSLPTETLTKVLDGNYNFVVSTIEVESTSRFVLRMENDDYNVKYWAALKND